MLKIESFCPISFLLFSCVIPPLIIYKLIVINCGIFCKMINMKYD
ncbi:putative lipoprotein [Leptospira weilii str. LNT 1234]|nr:putative lipoprotein [Leptospira weilii str. LNT 1234]